MSIKRDSSSPMKPLRFQISLKLSELSNIQSIFNLQTFPDSSFDSSLAKCSGKKYFFSQNSASIIHAFIFTFLTSILVFSFWSRYFDRIELDWPFCLACSTNTTRPMQTEALEESRLQILCLHYGMRSLKFCSRRGSWRTMVCWARTSQPMTGTISISTGEMC